VTGGRKYHKPGGTPREFLIVAKHAGYRDVFGESEEVVPDIVIVNNVPVAPEVLRVFKEVPLVRGNMDRDSLGDGLRIPLALIAMMVGVQYSLYGGDPGLRGKP
jgi:hypothetical protein